MMRPIHHIQIIKDYRVNAVFYEKFRLMIILKGWNSGTKLYKSTWFYHRTKNFMEESDVLVN